ncbi:MULTISPECIES: diaminopropionate ammonia-lyase [unclassified Actinomyces]|uniref:diaminopropionate ammonia-lyase n=1 Tax=unclassified Actinomyces TaxID=2609248 RepID=UPI000D58DC6C|nr:MULTISPECIES: diaminopropionate ammonia-lyase [unclassified Actinomyces]RAX20757.1 diaminopropionate ammonia-lyase [Actinomyces sp. Z5]RAX24567.1 diaminopropionate ammonia-lyase [Actinomyces sp. Z3]
MGTIRAVLGAKPENPNVPIHRYGLENAERARAWCRSFPEYRQTPLANLDDLASHLGVASLKVKDESERFGLNAFKVLGGSYAMGRVLAQRLGRELSDLPYPVLTSDETREALGTLTFVTATDGNHGRGVAWTANRLGLQSVVYMPRGSARERLKNIQALGANARITDLSYDDAVRFAAAQAEEHGWVLVQDTSWPGYEEIPSWIMEGYTTMGAELLEQLNGAIPTHVFLQAGVGSMAGAMAAFLANHYGESRPMVLIVEPEGADCIYRTAAADDGTLHAVKDPHTIMAGLSCGEPCGIAWKILHQYADAFLTIPDEVAATGMRILGNPLGSDRRIISGESGAATLGTVAELLRRDCYAPLRRSLRLGADARIVCISTEGDTDRDNYRHVVWDGRYASN